MSDTTEQDAPTLDPRQDLRADLEAAVSAMDEPKEAEPDTETQPDAREGRERDEHGRFVSKAQDDGEADTPTQPAPKAKTETDPAAPVEPVTPPPETAPKVDPPATWSAADKAMVAKLPADAQAFLVKRYGEMEADYTRKTTQIASLRRDYEPVAQMFEPHRQLMGEKGFTPHTLISAWMGVEKKLMDGGGVEVIADIARNYGIPPAAIAQRLGISTAPAAQPQPEPTLDANGQPATPQAPQQAAIHPEIARTLGGVIQWINTAEQRQQAERVAQQQQAEHRVMGEIARFAAEKDAAGALKRPYFAEVEDDMAAIAEVARKKGGDIPPLQELYDTAVLVNPMTRARLTEAQAAAQEAQRVSAERKRAEEARTKSARATRAAATVTGAPGTGNAGHRVNGETSLRDDIRSALSDHAA